MSDNDKPLPVVRSVLGEDSHMDGPMPRIFETDGAMAIIVIRYPHTVVNGEADLEVQAHVSDDVRPKVIAALLHGIADSIAEAEDHTP